MNLGILIKYSLVEKRSARFGDDVVRVTYVLCMCCVCVAFVLCMCCICVVYVRCCAVVFVTFVALLFIDHPRGGEMSGRPVLSFAAFHAYSRISTMPFSNPYDKSHHFFLCLAHVLPFINHYYY